MSHLHRHRGKRPEDDRLFAAENVPKLKTAVRDYSWLLSRGYAADASLKLVGDTLTLTARQRLLVRRCACTQVQLEGRRESELRSDKVTNRDLHVDGFNVLITLESALSGGFVFVGRDGCYRDLSSVHGSYKRVAETGDAILLIGETLNTLGVHTVRWLLDRPVSNSGRLRELLLDLAGDSGWRWEVELCTSPDSELKRSDEVVATTDSVVLDAVSSWFNLTRYVIERAVPGAEVVDLAS